MKINKQRLRLLILPKFQLRLLAWILFTQAVFLVLMIIQVQALALKLTQMGISAGFSEGHPYYGFIKELVAQNYSFLLVVTILGLVLSLGIALVVSHRISGPIYRLYQFFRDYPNDSSGKITFRKGDYIEDLAPLINQALAKTESSREG